MNAGFGAAIGAGDALDAGTDQIAALINGR
jgi:hypothetical protein